MKVNAFWTLVKAIFRQNFRIDKSTKRSRSAKAGMVVAYIVLGVTFLPITVVSMLSFSSIAIEANLGAELISMVFSTIQLFALLFGTIALVNTLFFSNDNEFLATLPIKPRAVFFAKLFYVCVNELILAGSIGTAALIVYGIIAGMGVLYYVFIIPCVVLATLLALLLSSIIMMPLYSIMKFMKANATISTIVSSLLFVAYMVGYVLLVSSFSNSFEGGLDPSSVNNILASLGKAFIFDLVVGKMLIGTATLSDVLLFVLIYGGGFTLTYIIASFGYKKGLQNTQTSHAEKMAVTKYEKTSVMKALIKRDWTCIRRESSLFFYCVMQVIMSPLMVFLMFNVMYKGMMESAEDYTMMLNGMGSFFLIMFGCGMNYVASSSFSRENQSFYILKTLPVPLTVIIRSKTNLALIFTVASIILSDIVLIISGMNIVTALLTGGYIMILGIAMVFWQVKIDLDKPRLNWQTVTEGLKNSPASTIVLFFTMGIGFVSMFVGIMKPVIAESGVISALLIDVIYFGVMYILSITLALVFHNGLYKKAAMLFDKIN